MAKVKYLRNKETGIEFVYTEYQAGLDHMEVFEKDEPDPVPAEGVDAATTEAEAEAKAKANASAKGKSSAKGK